MPIRLPRRTFLATLLAAAVVPLTGCDGGDQQAVKPTKPFEGKYKNSKGDVVLEITDASIFVTNPRTRARAEIPYASDGNKLSVESDVGNFTLTYNPDGTMTGLPPAVAGDTQPLKKAS